MLLRARWFQIAAHAIGAFGCLYGGIELLRHSRGGGLERYLEVMPLVVAFALLNAALGGQVRRRADRHDSEPRS